MTQSQAFGQYQLQKKLATGGMAEVWLARQTGIQGFNRHVVIKRILPHLAEDPEFVHMFLNEAKIASRFNHPNIAQIYDLGETAGTYYIAMEFIHGEDLGRIMRRAFKSGQWVARALAIRIIADACAGLHYAHSRTDEQGRPLKVVHRDISPQNILVSFDGSVKLVDFGIAKASDQASNTRSGSLKGKFAYMAPEQAQGKPLDNRSDLFALGLVLYELVTGVRPLKRDSELSTLQAALECVIEAPSVVAEVPTEIDEVVMHALAKNPHDRYRDARQFQMALEQLLVTEGTVATSVQVSELMEHLFADRLAEEARSGAPAPPSASSTSNVVAPQAQQLTMGSVPTEYDAPRPSPVGVTIAPSPPRTASVALSETVASPSGRMGSSARLASIASTSLSGAAMRPATVAAPPPVRPSPPVRPPTVEYDFKRARTPSSAGLLGESADELSCDGVDEPAPAHTEPAPDPVPQRQTTGSIRKRVSSSSMPDAPARKSRGPVVRILPRRSDSLSALNRALDVDALRRRAALRAAVLLIVLLLGGVAIFAYLFPTRVAALLHTQGMLTQGIPVLLTITSNPPTKVTVVPSSTSADQEWRELGFTPTDSVPGAFVGDTVVLSNRSRGIHYEQIIDSGRANEVKIIDKVFKETMLRVRTKPALKNATVWLNDLQVGRVGMPLKVYEGTQTFEVRGDSLIHPVEFEVHLDPTKALHEQEVDVSSVVTGKGL